MHAIFLAMALAYDGTFVTEYARDGTRVAHVHAGFMRHRPRIGIYCRYDDGAVLFSPKRTDWNACPLIKPKGAQ